MSTTTDDSQRKLKILMLHGFTQSGPLFHAKTRALEKALQKAMPAMPAAPHNKKPPPGMLPSYPGGIELIYPTGPMRLRPSDIPGFDTSKFDGGEANAEETDAWAWWKRETGSGEYTGLNEGMSVIAKAIKQAGGIDGVIGFSQGACAATFVASLLETGRKAAFDKIGKQPYPPSFVKADGEPINPPLKFCISYSGFYAPYPQYEAFYNPKIATPIAHFVGTLDTVVEESRVTPLIEACADTRTIHHPGGHFVPIGREMVGVLIGFIRDVCTEKKVEESAEDMDVPF